MPENELWQLFRAAYELYQSEILNGEKAFSRYANDFFTYHLPAICMNEADIRLHVMNVCRVKELLDNRRDLVDAFFTRPTFDECDYQKMYKLFNTGKNLQLETDYLVRFGEKQLNLIKDFINDTRMFRDEVTVNDIENLFTCKLTTPLQANNNRHVAVFLGALREVGLLPYAWQKIMEEYKLVSSSSNNQPLRASQLRCGLSQAKKAKLGKSRMSDQKNPDYGFESACNSFVKKLKESL